MTGLQLLCLRFIDRYIAEHGGVSPSVEEIRVALGLTAKSHVCRLTDALAADGYIRKPKNRVRAIEVLRKPDYRDADWPAPPRVVLYTDRDGNKSVFAPAGVTVFWLDERAPRDRVYRQERVSTEAEIDAVLADDIPGHAGDERQARLKVQLHHMEHGLKPVDTST